MIDCWHGWGETSDHFIISSKVYSQIGGENLWRTGFEKGLYLPLVGLRKENNNFLYYYKTHEDMVEALLKYDF